MGVETEEEHVGPPIPMATDTSDQTPDDGPPAPKKRKAVNANELNLLENLPAADRYEKSYMHRKLFNFFAPYNNHEICAYFCLRKI